MTMNSKFDIVITMPMHALANAPLHFIDDATVLLDLKHIFNMPPWTNTQFRRLIGFKPLRGTDTNDIDIAAIEHDEAELADLPDGFALTKKAYAALKSNTRPFFDEKSQHDIVTFLQRLGALALQQCAYNAKAVKGAKGKRKKGGRANDAESNMNTCLVRLDKIPGYHTFTKATLALLNLPGGILSVVQKVMEHALRTPLHAWRDKVAANNVSPAFKVAQQVDIYIKLRFFALKETDDDDDNDEEDEDKTRSTGKYSPTSVPPPGNYVRGEVLTAVAIELFGVKAVTQSTRMVKPAYQQFTLTVLQRCWERPA